MGTKNRFYADIMSVHPEVTGSCNLIFVKFPNGEIKKFIVDCGLFQEREYEKLNSVIPINLDEVAFCLVTHNHVDHIGKLPLIVANGYTKEVYATEDTCTLMPYALTDSCKVLRDLAKRKNAKCLYRERHVEETLNLLKPCKFNETINVDENIKVTFFMNGHLLGAAVILVQITYEGYEDINLLFTGDYNDKNVFFEVDKIPKWVQELPLTIIQEATYGNRDSNNITKCFKENIIKCIENNGTVVVPVFSLGRAQEILYELKKMQELKILSEEILIYFDGKLSMKYTNLYLGNRLKIKQEMRDFLPENLIFVDEKNRDYVLRSKIPKIIVTSSGMGSYGPAQLYIPEYISRGNALIHFTGYTAEGTLGNKLEKAEKGETVQIGGVLLRKSSDVKYTTEFSAHSKADEMIAFLKQFSDLRMVAVNHGETRTKEFFAKSIVNKTNAKNVGILGGGYLFRVGHYGLIKSRLTQFE